MGTINIERIATNAYAPEGADAINLYSVGSAKGLSFGQAVLAVSIRRIAMLEQRAVVRMNRMSSGNDLMRQLADWMNDLSDTGKSVDTRGIRNFMLNTLRMAPDSIPEDMSTNDGRLRLLDLLKERMESESTTSQHDMIDLQSVLSVRDITSTMSANMVKGYGQTGNTLAGNLA